MQGFGIELGSHLNGVNLALKQLADSTICVATNGWPYWPYAVAVYSRSTPARAGADRRESVREHRASRTHHLAAKGLELVSESFGAWIETLHSLC